MSDDYKQYVDENAYFVQEPDEKQQSLEIETIADKSSDIGKDNEMIGQQLEKILDITSQIEVLNDTRSTSAKHFATTLEFNSRELVTTQRVLRQCCQSVRNVLEYKPQSFENDAELKKRWDLIHDFSREIRKSVIDVQEFGAEWFGYLNKLYYGMSYFYKTIANGHGTPDIAIMKFQRAAKEFAEFQAKNEATIMKVREQSEKAMDEIERTFGGGKAIKNAQEKKGEYLKKHVEEMEKLRELESEKLAKIIRINMQIATLNGDIAQHEVQLKYANDEIENLEQEQRNAAERATENEKQAESAKNYREELWTKKFSLGKLIKINKKYYKNVYTGDKKRLEKIADRYRKIRDDAVSVKEARFAIREEAKRKMKAARLKIAAKEKEIVTIKKLHHEVIEAQANVVKKAKDDHDKCLKDIKEAIKKYAVGEHSMEAFFTSTGQLHQASLNSISATKNIQINVTALSQIMTSKCESVWTIDTFFNRNDVNLESLIEPLKKIGCHTMRDIDFAGEDDEFKELILSKLKGHDSMQIRTLTRLCCDKNEVKKWKESEKSLGKSNRANLMEEVPGLTLFFPALQRRLKFAWNMLKITDKGENEKILLTLPKKIKALELDDQKKTAASAKQISNLKAIELGKSNENKNEKKYDSPNDKSEKKKKKKKYDTSSEESSSDESSSDSEEERRRRKKKKKKKKKKSKKKKKKKRFCDSSDSDDDTMDDIDINDIEIQLMGISIGKHTDFWNCKEYEIAPRLIINKHTNSMDLCMKSIHGDNVKISIKNDIIKCIYIPQNPQLFNIDNLKVNPSKLDACEDENNIEINSCLQMIFIQTINKLNTYQWLQKFYDPNTNQNAGMERITIFMNADEYKLLKTNWWMNKMLFMDLHKKVTHIKDDEKELWLQHIRFGRGIKNHWKRYDTDRTNEYIDYLLNGNESELKDDENEPENETENEEPIDITEQSEDIDINILEMENCGDFNEYIRNDEILSNPHHTNSLKYAQTRRDEPSKTLECYWVFPAQHEHRQCIMHIETKDYTKVTICDEYLNDTIVDFQLKYTYSAWPAMFKDKVYIFSSFFWKKLVKIRSKNTTNQQLNQILRWTKHIKSLFNKEYIIIPKCEHQHWELVIICYHGKVLQKYLNNNNNNNMNEEKDIQTPCIAILDSLVGTHKSSEFNVIRKWLNLEAKNYIKLMENNNENSNNSNKECNEFETDDIDIFNSKSIKGYCCKVPKQPNGHDCGCFLLRNVLQFGIDKGFKDTSTKKVFNLSKWYRPKEDGVGYRQDISDRLARLIKEQKNINDKLRLEYENKKKMLIRKQIQRNKEKEMENKKKKLNEMSNQNDIK